MATKNGKSPPAGTFNLDTQEHGYDDGPDHVHVEINGRLQGGMAIIAAGAEGRYSFDFTTSSSGIQLTKAFIEGMREPVDELPEWTEAVREEVERQLGLA